MLRNTRQLYGRKLQATDGEIGQVKDFYFDDASWAVRYLVADTGSWLSGRQVLLPPHAFEYGRFGASEDDTSAIRVNLTRKQIENSPSIDSDLPVSRQYEMEYHRYYGWPEYWQDSGTWGMAGSPVLVPLPPAPPATMQEQASRTANDIHLRSMKAVTGYEIHATGGAIGSVNGFMIDDKTWTIREVVVEAGHWYAGKKILLLPENILRISYEESTVTINLTKDDMKQTRENDVVQTGAGLP